VIYSYALPISANLAAASGEVLFFGWYFKAKFRYASFILAYGASFEISSTL